MIDRTNPFNPTEFIGKDWSIWRGPKDGNGLQGKEEQDSRSLALSEIDPTKFLKPTGLKDGETSITGEEKRARLLLEAIQLDAKIGEELFKEAGQVTLRWLHKAIGLTWFECLGTTLRSPSGRRYSLYLYRNGDGSWGWRYRWLDNDRDVNYPALGVAS